MTDQDKFVALIRLRDMLYFGVRPTMRQCGQGLETVRSLTQEGFIQLTDKQFGEEPDRYVIEAILPAGKTFIAEQKALRNPAC
jgi:hypothetical protein